jgi:carboxyl-terminal processing protease
MAIKPVTALALLIGFTPFTSYNSFQGLTKNETYLIHGMLENAYETVKAHYYDPTFRGLDWDARYREYEEKLKAATSVDRAEAVVASFLSGLKDSHTNFFPPARTFDVDYGFVLGLVGNETFVTHVRPGTDAAPKLEPGDRVLTLDTLTVDRENFLGVLYVLNTLAPRATSTFELTRPNGQISTVEVKSVVKPKRVVRTLTNGNEISAVDKEQQDAQRAFQSRVFEMQDVTIWKLPGFFLEDAAVDQLFATVRKHAKLILDLRSNPGGRVVTLDRIIGNLFDRDVTVVTRTTRAGRIVEHAPTRGRNAFTGDVVVLIDSRSTSAAEILARVVQLEHRGIVLGDRSGGAVMESLSYPFRMGNDALAYYGFSVTEADLVMTDGHSLENVGVTPDEVTLPTAADMAAGRDPALAKAAQRLGLRLDPVAAGKLFPDEWNYALR